MNNSQRPFTRELIRPTKSKTPLTLVFVLVFTGAMFTFSCSNNSSNVSINAVPDIEKDDYTADNSDTSGSSTTLPAIKIKDISITPVVPIDTSITTVIPVDDIIINTTTSFQPEQNSLIENRPAIINLSGLQSNGTIFDPNSVAGKNVLLWFWTPW